MIRKSLFSSKSTLIDVHSLEHKFNPKLIKQINDNLNMIEEFDFDIFALDKLTGKDTLLYCATEIFDILNL